MTDETLEKANKLKDEISKLEWFIKYAEMCWSHLSFTDRIKRRYIKHRGYGVFAGEEYQLSNELSKKILVVMKEHLEELQEQYKQIEG